MTFQNFSKPRKVNSIECFVLAGFHCYFILSFGKGMLKCHLFPNMFFFSWRKDKQVNKYCLPQILKCMLIYLFIQGLVIEQCPCKFARAVKPIPTKYTEIFYVLHYVCLKNHNCTERCCYFWRQLHFFLYYKNTKQIIHMNSIWL